MMKALSPKDAAAALNVTYSGLRYLELLGQVHPKRDSSGRRSYSPREIERLAKTRTATTPTK